MHHNLKTNLLITLLFLSGCIVVPNSNADSFALKEGIYQDSNKIIIKNIDLVTLTDTTMIVTWTTNINSSTYIDYGTHPFYLGNHYSDDYQTSVSFHYLELDGLEPGSTYFYRVGSNNSRSRLQFVERIYRGT